MRNPSIDQNKNLCKSERGKQTRKQIKAFSRRFTTEVYAPIERNSQRKKTQMLRY